MVGMPAIIVGDHGDDGVGQLGLARQLHFRHRRHANDAAAPSAIELAFRHGRELRPLDGDVDAALVVADLLLAGRQGERIGQAWADRMRHRHMRHEAGAEEAGLAREGAVDELVGHQEGARRQLFLQRTAGRHRNHVGDADTLQGIDIGAVIDAAGRLDMATSVARQEDHVDAVQGAGQKLVGRLAPGASDGLPAGILQPLNVIDAGTANDSENCPGHGFAGAGRLRGVLPHPPKQTSRGSPRGLHACSAACAEGRTISARTRP